MLLLAVVARISPRPIANQEGDKAHRANQRHRSRLHRIPATRARGREKSIEQRKHAESTATTVFQPSESETSDDSTVCLKGVNIRSTATFFPRGDCSGPHLELANYRDGTASQGDTRAQIRTSAVTQTQIRTETSGTATGSATLIQPPPA